MQFRSRIEGDFVLTRGDIQIKRTVKRGETIPFTEKTLGVFDEQ